MKLTRVAVVGATGETGSSIVDGLLASAQFDIVAFIRPQSLLKPANALLRERGVDTVAVDLVGAQEHLVAALKGIDIVVVAVSAFDYAVQIPLATAAKSAGVKRFLPSSYTSVTPAGGITELRDEREKIYDYIKQISLPYTIVDVGWWYQGSLPRLPSGRFDYAVQFSSNIIAGDGNTPSAMTDKRDIGKYIAEIIQDDRTVNKSVLAYSEVWSSNEIYDRVERISGEQPLRTYVTEEQIRDNLQQSIDSLATDCSNLGAIWGRIASEYQLSREIRGDNTPESAKCLGYLTSKELYPNFEYRRFEDLVYEMLEGQGVPLYQSNERIQALFNKPK